MRLHLYSFPVLASKTDTSVAKWFCKRKRLEESLADPTIFIIKPAETRNVEIRASSQ